jgi:S1-C subfamily serine protease
MRSHIGTLGIIALLLAADSAGQNAGTTAKQSIPIATQLLLDNERSPAQQRAIQSVLMIQCPKDNSKGTGFALVGGGVITTNSHVVGSCTKEELKGISSLSEQPITFSSMVQDANRDLALLCTAEPLATKGLELKGDERPAIDTEVVTWGYPLRYQLPAPILSRGYVAGYLMEIKQDNVGRGNPVAHLIINGALNPGNSGGPLIDRETGKVIGIVVEKWGLYSPLVETVISGLQRPGVSLSGRFSRTDANGRTVPVTDEEAMAAALQELYEKSQVVVGEAISVSELNSFIKERRKDLACGAANKP